MSTAVFPSELADVLNAKGKAILNGRARKPVDQPSVVFWGEVVDRRKTDKLIKILDEKFYAVLSARPTDNDIIPIPRDYRGFALDGVAPYSCRVRCGYVNKTDDPEVYELADKYGINTFMNSQSLLQFASKVTGYELAHGSDGAYGQLSCYQKGDYVGLHSDWYGTAKSTHYFVDLQIHLPNRYTESHLFIYQRGEHLNGCVDFGATPSLSVCRFPFWHMTTPLRSRPRHDAKARRWLLMTALEIGGSGTV
ncbi:MAG: hypothetical protein MJE77_03745 [Proteobacteria bacterium]|nr:hypothetical protein [Pseudomonadota bacterium]